MEDRLQSPGEGQETGKRENSFSWAVEKRSSSCFKGTGGDTSSLVVCCQQKSLNLGPESVTKVTGSWSHREETDTGDSAQGVPACQA